MRKQGVFNIKAKCNYYRSHPGFRRAPILTVARLLWWGWHCVLGRQVIAKLPRWGLHIVLPVQWRGVGKNIFLFRENYEPELAYLENLLSAGRVFVDVGACLGIYALAASRLVGERGRVLAFEPASKCLTALHRSLELNRISNVRTWRVALLDRSSRARLYHHPYAGSDALSPVSNGAGGFEEVDTGTLDEKLQEACIPHVDVVKVDAEGAEELIIRGAISMLTSARPTIIFEHNPEAANRLGLSGYGAWDLLKRLGYRFYLLHDSGSLSGIQSPPPPPVRNVIAVHPAGAA